jgi:hypothetical protein
MSFFYLQLNLHRCCRLSHCQPVASAEPTNVLTASVDYKSAFIQHLSTLDHIVLINVEHNGFIKDIAVVIVNLV